MCSLFFPALHPSLVSIAASLAAAACSTLSTLPVRPMRTEREVVADSRPRWAWPPTTREQTTQPATRSLRRSHRSDGISATPVDRARPATSFGKLGGVHERLYEFAAWLVDQPRWGNLRGGDPHAEAASGRHTRPL